MEELQKIKFKEQFIWCVEEQNFNMPSKPSLIHVLSLLSVKTFFDKSGSVCSI